MWCWFTCQGIHRSQCALSTWKPMSSHGGRNKVKENNYKKFFVANFSLIH